MAYLHILNHYDPENSYPTVKNLSTGKIEKGSSCVSLWFNSCSKKCKLCFNPETWGRKKSLYRDNDEIVEEVLIALEEFFPKNLALLGGDPLENSFDQDFRNNIDDTFYILTKIKEKRPETKVLCWTGYTWNECLNNEKVYKVLKNGLIDVLVDEPFVVEKKIEGKMYGSSNQHVINVKESLKQNKMIVFPEL